MIGKCSNPFLNKLAAYSFALFISSNSNRAEGKSFERSGHPRKHYVTDDFFIFDGDKRKNAIAICAQLIDCLSL